MVYIYILKLEHNKYYIGKTDNPNIRLEKHFNLSGSAWTKKYKPIELIQLIPNCDVYDEDKYTIKYMDEYGINNVRGGSFCQIKLSDSNIITLKQMLKSVSDKCYICGENGHYSTNCTYILTNTIEIDNNKKCNCITSYFFPHREKRCALKIIKNMFDSEYEDIDKLNNITAGTILNKNYNCYRCGRKGHFIASCFALTNIDGVKLN